MKSRASFQNASQPGDVILVEQLDRLSRLNADDWQKLKAEIGANGVRVVALDLSTSHQFIPREGNGMMFGPIGSYRPQVLRQELTRVDLRMRPQAALMDLLCKK